MTGLLSAGNAALADWMGYDFSTDPSQLQAMNAEQMAEYQRRQGDPRNVPMSEQSLAGIQNAWRPPVRKPTMTLSEYDARRAAFDAP